VPKIFVHRQVDLPSAIAVAVGEQVGNSQRFSLQATPITRRLYTIRVEGPHDPGVYVVQIHGLIGDVLRSVPVEIPYGFENGVVTAEIVGPIFGEFVVEVVKVGDVPRPQTETGGSEPPPGAGELPQ
jgi:hypothetical protein